LEGGNTSTPPYGPLHASVSLSEDFVWSESLL